MGRLFNDISHPVKAFITTAFTAGGAAAGGLAGALGGGLAGAAVSGGTMAIPGAGIGATEGAAYGAGIGYVAANVTLIAADAIDNWFNSDDAEAPRTKAGKLQGEVRKGQAPDGVKRVDSADPNIPGSKDHVHYEDGTSSNWDGTTHDAHRGQPNPNRETRKWLDRNGWTSPPR